MTNQGIRGGAGAGGAAFTGPGGPIITTGPYTGSTPTPANTVDPDIPVYLVSAYAELPDAVVFPGSFVAGTSPPADDRFGWLDTTGAPSDPKIWDAAASSWLSIVGARGAEIFTGSGAPGTITGQADGDLYLDTAAGNLYQLAAGAWGLIANIIGPAGPTGPAGSAPLTVSTAALTIPATGSTATLAVLDGSAIGTGVEVIVNDGTSLAHFQAVSGGTNTLTLKALGENGDAAGGTVIGIGAVVAVCGQQGSGAGGGVIDRIEVGLDASIGVGLNGTVSYGL